MGIHRIEPGTENATECSVPSLFALSQMALSKPVRGPIFTGVLSTKYTDDETGLIMYQLRAYSPGLGRFISRDPAGEDGGANIYGFCQNDQISQVDPVGLNVYAVYRQFNDIKEGGELAAKFDHGKCGSVGHVYLAFDEVGVDRDQWSSLISEFHHSYLWPIVPARDQNELAETFSFHPWGVRELNGKSDTSGDIGAQAGLPGGVVTTGSYIGYNDDVDQGAFLKAKKLGHLSGIDVLKTQLADKHLEAVVVQIKATEDEQYSFYRQVQQSRQMNNVSAESGDIGPYNVTWRNCGFWVVTMIKKSGLAVPPSVKNFNLGTGNSKGVLHHVGKVGSETLLKPIAYTAHAVGAQIVLYNNDGPDKPTGVAGGGR